VLLTLFGCTVDSSPQIQVMADLFPFYPLTVCVDEFTDDLSECFGLDGTP
jgi:hypothetical protein